MLHNLNWKHFIFFILQVHLHTYKSQWQFISTFPFHNKQIQHFHSWNPGPLWASTGPLPSSRSNLQTRRNSLPCDRELTPPPMDGRPSSSTSQSLEGTLTCQCPGLQRTDKCKPSWLVRTSTICRDPRYNHPGGGTPCPIPHLAI